MAHKVSVKKRAVFAQKDGHLLKGKYKYRVKCQRCGVLHLTTITSGGVAGLLKDTHHAEVHAEHHSKHPNDKAHLRTDLKKMVKSRG